MIEYIEIDAPSLQGFPSRDPSKRELALYVPPTQVKTQTYGLIFVLAGWGSRSAKYLRHDSAFGRSLEEELDQLILEKKMPPVLVGFPDGRSTLGFSQYINSPSLGNYQNFIAEDLIKELEKKYPIAKESSGRGIMGHSSGGFGSLWMGFQRPEVFGHVCASAADSFFEVSILPALTHMVPEIERAGGLSDFIENFKNQPDPLGSGYSSFLTMMTLSLAPCYAPNPTEPILGGDLFFELKTGQIDEKIWKRWKLWDPADAIDRHLDELRSLKSLVLECGLRDEYGLQLGHRQMAKKLKQAGIDFEFQEYTGKHSGHNWRFAQRIQAMANKMKVS